MMGDVRLDHVHVRVRDLDASRRFYVAVAEALEFGPIKAGDGWFELGELHVSADGPATTNLHFAFQAPDRSVIERFYAAALAAGGRDNGAPGYRPRYHRGYFSAYVFDPDGNNVEAVVHER
jgi:catechol 2,3-dioxygenase-like lactoylglutathione lyase family enzyme